MNSSLLGVEVLYDGGGGSSSSSGEQHALQVSSLWNPGYPPLFGLCLLYELTGALPVLCCHVNWHTYLYVNSHIKYI